MAAIGISPEVAEQIGLTEDDFVQPEEAISVWPEDEPVLSVFIAMSSQWSWANGIATGLNYAALGEVWQRLGIPEADRNEAFQYLRVMEQEASAQIAQDARSAMDEAKRKR